MTPTQNWTFGRGVCSAKSTFIAAFTSNSDGEPIPITRIYQWSNGKVARFVVRWEVKALCYLTAPEPHLVLVSPFGNVAIFVSGQRSEEVIDPSEAGPQGLG